MTENNRLNISPKEEALLILEYLENEQMSKTFLNFLDENKHLAHLHSRLYANYENPELFQNENDLEVLDFQNFFNLSKQNERLNQTFLSSELDSNNPHDLLFDDDFLTVGLNDLMSQTPPMDYQHDLPDTPVPSVPPMTADDNEDFNSALEQLFSMHHEPLSTPPHQIVQVISDTNPKPSFTKCIVVTQDFLQSMYTQQQPTIASSAVKRKKSRQRRLKKDKENYHQQRKIMPRTPPDYQ
ncbi:unnamed protein product [Rotaria socialis]|uniref:Uncharacterized protein n=4 Tax=Rotaria socialis TaxID=392032 RepID=A0A820XXT4_9BILA|nr:unnamed protein product [Rotaria socialis]CAF3443269.1 unnamed protein product [Rotaria socialis]CAF3482483.1 unnamed protein product [Rotaria socialis]CAF3547634.1 unnamed protein product [Rotaria socialis]CAF3593362.1 unnamed protein product [Rotaria socialis]